MELMSRCIKRWCSFNELIYELSLPLSSSSSRIVFPSIHVASINTSLPVWIFTLFVAFLRPWAFFYKCCCINVFCLILCILYSWALRVFVFVFIYLLIWWFCRWCYYYYFEVLIVLFWGIIFFSPCSLPCLSILILLYFTLSCDLHLLTYFFLHTYLPYIPTYLSIYLSVCPSPSLPDIS